MRMSGIRAIIFTGCVLAAVSARAVAEDAAVIRPDTDDNLGRIRSYDAGRQSSSAVNPGAAVEKQGWDVPDPSIDMTIPPMPSPAKNLPWPRLPEMTTLPKNDLTGRIFLNEAARRAGAQERKKPPSRTLKESFIVLLEVVVAGSDELWQDIRAQYPALYGVLIFFNPSLFQHIAFHLLTIFFAFIGFFIVPFFDGAIELSLRLACYYCWGRILTYAVILIMSINGKI